MLLPEVTPGNQVGFGISIPEEKALEAPATKTKTLSNCPATNQDSYLKKALCSCKSMFSVSAPVSVEIAKNLPAKTDQKRLQAAKKPSSQSNYLADLLRVDFSSRSGR